MPKGRKSSPGSKVEEEEIDASLTEPPFPKINLYDSGSVKHYLDESARQVVLDSGFEEDHSTGNVKIVLGFLAIGTALASHLLPGKFPANGGALLGCVILYFVLTMILAIYSTRAEGDAFLLTRKESGDIRLSSQMARFSTNYVLTLENRTALRACGNKEKCLAETSSTKMQKTYNIANFFHSDGYLAEDLWRAEVTKLLNAYFAEDASPTIKSCKSE
mmetsp:Transcript_11217/g.20311  ORF Transcript_11217/g.20311 Transcript_11217/m.20311 type:complete len:218 (-) Transcript_11217:349-1002(-)|eukprot:CAMPEP_0175086080 /NCGR_PEP_ID=MMETSP0052_2-20121109/29038_1 /TAXON_ID=51329 ORGANISM="Polytomella parva, Strain SAG 63-3" /NCGR_SAMPLE_ID=MMETSP0052_2 /ASSEMBLY_ACC=CAM_ASM_000194 /LENGTH=217 /DNA_ID=CAMNT_0016358199 /DNA_START=97 /DNA_END=750 /DNA_ORIENTATION=+